MKTKIVLAKLAFLMVLSTANASDSRSEKQLSDSEKEKIVWAIKILVRTKTINLETNKCEKVNCEILDQLEAEGLLNQSDLSPQAICVVPE